MQLEQQLQKASSARARLEAEVAGLQRSVASAEQDKADAKADLHRCCEARCSFAFVGLSWRCIPHAPMFTQTFLSVIRCLSSFCAPDYCNVAQ